MNGSTQSNLLPVALRDRPRDPASDPTPWRPPQPAAGPLSPEGPAVAVLWMCRTRPRDVPWLSWRLVRGPSALRGTPGLRFARVLGSGAAGGFGLKPGLDCQGLFATFDTLAAAVEFEAGHRWLNQARDRALETFSTVLWASSSRGSWAGHAMRVAAPTPPADAPIVALTRASIRPHKALAFWRHSPPAERSLAAAPGCLLAVGLGEAPVLRQATFSLWSSTRAMNHYARQGAHQQAIQASYAGGFFSEWMFVRFVPLSLRGVWQGQALDQVLALPAAARPLAGAGHPDTTAGPGRLGGPGAPHG